MPVSKQKKGTYCKSLTWTEKDGTKWSLATQVYTVGIYLCVSCENRMAQQGSTTPMALQRQQKKQLKRFEDEGIEYNLGPQITVVGTENGWEELT